MDVSENNGTPKSSILIGFSIINHPFWGTPILGNTHIPPQKNSHVVPSRHDAGWKGLAARRKTAAEVDPYILRYGDETSIRQAENQGGSTWVRLCYPGYFCFGRQKYP